MGDEGSRREGRREVYGQGRWKVAAAHVLIRTNLDRSVSAANT